jgi:prepilin-type N-terminal cleavage/methylation domain-containing protein
VRTDAARKARTKPWRRSLQDITFCRITAWVHAGRSTPLNFSPTYGWCIVRAYEPRGCGRGRAAGYSLVELLTAVVVVGILCGLAAPALSGWTTRWRMEAALDRFQGSYSYARIVAIRSGTPVELAFTPSTREVCLERISVVLLTEPPRIAREVFLQEEFRGLCLMQNNARPVRFDSRGMPGRSDNRSVWVRSGPMVDSLTVSMLGNISRRF